MQVSARAFKGYQVHSNGVVISKRTGKPLSTPKNARGYPLVQLWEGGVLKTYTLHKLISLVFSGPTPAGYEVDHKDNNKENNEIDNLVFVTRSENMKKMWKHNGTQKISGFSSHNSKYSKETFELVLELITKGLPNREIHKLVDIKKGTLIKLRNGTHFYAKQQ